MPQDYTLNIKKARLAVPMTQETAAELADVSVQSWKAYELHQRIPPQDVMARICKVLGADWLALEWLSLTTEQLGVLPELETKELPLSVLQFINQAADLTDDYRDLMRIAEDGVIDDGEADRFSEISEKVRRLAALAISLIYAPGIKKDRPDAGTSERLSSRPKSKNDRTTILAHRSENVNTFSRRGGAVV